MVAIILVVVYPAGWYFTARVISRLFRQEFPQEYSDEARGIALVMGLAWPVSLPMVVLMFRPPVVLVSALRKIIP